VAGRYRLTVREGPRVERAAFATLPEALDELADRVSDLAARVRRPTVDIKTRQFAPDQQVAARAQLAEGGRLLSRALGGVDVRGDGSTEAYTGGVHREVVQARRGETSAQALRRALET